MRFSLLRECPSFFLHLSFSLRILFKTPHIVAQKFISAKKRWEVAPLLGSQESSSHGQTHFFLCFWRVLNVFVFLLWDGGIGSGESFVFTLGVVCLWRKECWWVYWLCAFVYVKLGRRAGWFDEFFEGLEGFSNGIRRLLWKFYRDDVEMNFGRFCDF